MANKQDKKKGEHVQNARSEPTYSRAEIMASAFSFGVKPEVMAGALKLANKDELTKSEIKEAIEQFKRRRV